MNELMAEIFDRGFTYIVAAITPSRNRYYVSRVDGDDITTSDSKVESKPFRDMDSAKTVKEKLAAQFPEDHVYVEKISLVDEVVED